MKRDIDLEIVIRNQHFILAPEKGLFWIEEKSLIIADVHLGKSGHFQKAGIPVPSVGNSHDLNVISNLITLFSPSNLIFLGDLFHSFKNKEWDMFMNFRKKFEELEMILVLGNHEIHASEEYEKLGLNTVTELKLPPFIFIHDSSTISSDNYIISGHIHPSITFKGKGRQYIKVPVFLFSDSEGMLPAFGILTGTHPISTSAEDRIYGIIDHQIIEL